MSMIHFGSTVFSKSSPQSYLYKGRLTTGAARCQSSSPDPSNSSKNEKLKIGSAIIVVEAPPTLKTATSMPSLRVNAGEVKPGDVGRIVSRKPKDVWAVRLAIGTYLIDGKHFKPLDLDE